MSRNKQKKNGASDVAVKPGSDGTTGPTASTSLAPGDIWSQAKARTAAHDEAVRASLGERGRELADEHKVPVWTIRWHNRVGHVGGFLTFLLIVAVALPVVAMVGWSVLVSLGVRLVTELPPAVLGELGQSQALVSSSTDRFVFSWVMPVLFFVLVLAGAMLWLLRWLAIWSARWARRLSLGLFAGYRTGPLTDWRELRLRRALVRSERDRRATRTEQAVSGQDR